MTLPESWSTVDFSEVTPPSAPIIYGILQPGPDRSDGVPYVRPTEIIDGTIDLDSVRRTSPEIAEQYSRSKLEFDDTILTIVGTIGKVAGVPRELEGSNITQSSCRIRADRELVEPAFLRHFLRGPTARAQYDRKRLGTAVLRLNIADIRKFKMPLPPLAEQRRIVAKVDALAACHAGARAELDRVPVLADRGHLAILRFGVSGALTADWRLMAEVESVADLLKRVPAPQQGRGGREATDKIIAGTAAIAVNDPGTTLPDGWAWVPLLRIAKQETGHTPSRSRLDYWDGGVPWIGIRDAGAHHGKFIQETAQTISAVGLANSSARILPEGTVCLSRTASVGYVTVMGKPMATSQDFATWTCTEALLPEYLMYAFMAEGDDIRNFGMGSTHTTIYFPEVRAFHIALPPIAEQREIAARVKRALARADHLKAEAARARALIDRLESAILAQAFRGELVPQDPNDEPASALLVRIRAARAEAPKPKRGRRPRAGELPVSSRPAASSKVSHMTKSRHDDDVMSKPYLAMKLKHMRSGSVQALFGAADLPVADFYKQLAWEIDNKHIIDDSDELRAA